MNKSKNIRSAFNQIINEVGEVPPQGSIVVKGGARRGVGRWKHVNTPTPDNERMATLGMNAIHPDPATNIGKDLVNVGRGNIPFQPRQVVTPTQGAVPENAYVPFLSPRHHEIIKDIHQGLILGKNNPHTEEYHNLLGQKVLSHPEFGAGAIADAKAKYELDRDVGNYAVMGNSTHPVHKPMIQDILGRHGNNPNFHKLVGLHRSSENKESVTDMIRNGNFHVSPQDKIVDTAVDKAGGPVPETPRQDSSTKIIYRKSIKALFESVLDELREEDNAVMRTTPNLTNLLAVSPHEGPQQVAGNSAPKSGPPTAEDLQGYHNLVKAAAIATHFPQNKEAHKLLMNHPMGKKLLYAYAGSYNAAREQGHNHGIADQVGQGDAMKELLNLP